VLRLVTLALALVLTKFISPRIQHRDNAGAFEGAGQAVQFSHGCPTEVKAPYQLPILIS
jgi:hypothetical protein